MKITELNLVMNNLDRMDKEDIKALNRFKVLEQYKNGELDLPAVEMLELLSLLTYLCSKHNLQ